MRLFRTFVEFALTSSHARREAFQAAYLSEAADLPDLEARVREIDGVGESERVKSGEAGMAVCSS